MGVSLTDHQFAAVRKTRDWFRQARWAEYAEKFALGGYAGTGKSTILPVLIEEFGVNPYDVAFMAPTGKAAKVMSNKMRAMGMNAVATTIHKAIYRPKAERYEILGRQLRDLGFELEEAQLSNWDAIPELLRKKRQLEKDLDRAYDSKEMSFQLNVDSDIRSKKLIVVDEASMVGEQMADDIRSFGIPVLAIGDPGQLPPVKGTPGLIIGEPDVLLEEIHRQAADNPIIWFATKLRNMEMPDYGTHGDALRIIRRRDDDVTYDISRAAAIVCGTKRARWKITTKLRDLMGYGPAGPQAGEPLIVIKNSLIHPGLVNGCLADCMETVKELHTGDTDFRLLIEDEDGIRRSLRVLQQPFEAHYLMHASEGTASKAAIRAVAKRTDAADWAYALTCHKMQGSQADEVIVHDEMGVFRDECWKWAYTAATRAAERLVWVS